MGVAVPVWEEAKWNANHGRRRETTPTKGESGGRRKKKNQKTRKLFSSQKRIERRWVSLTSPGEEKKWDRVCLRYFGSAQGLREEKDQ